MKRNFKSVVCMALASLVMLGSAALAGAAEWTPKNNVTMLVPWSAGGGADTAVRTLVPYLEKDLGVRITVVNATGAGDAFMAAMVAAELHGLPMRQAAACGLEAAATALQCPTAVSKQIVKLQKLMK